MVGGDKVAGYEIVVLSGRCYEREALRWTSAYAAAARRTLGSSPPILGETGTRFRGHRFRYSELAPQPAVERVDRVYAPPSRRGEAIAEGYRSGSARNVLASYVRAHWASNPAVARSLVESCVRFAAGRRRNPEKGGLGMTRAAAFVVDDGALADVASREGSVEVSRGVAVGSGVAVDVSQASVEVPQGALEDLRVELD